MQTFLPDGRMELEAALSLLDEDVDWDMSRSPFPDARLYRGVDGVREWFRGPEGESLIQQLMNSSIRKRNFFDYGFIERLADEHRREVRDWSANLWCLLNLSVWYDRWIA